MDHKNMLVSLLLFSGVIIGMSSFYGSLTDSNNLAAYGMNADQINSIAPQNLRSRNVINNITGISNDISNNLGANKLDTTLTDAAFGYIAAGLNSIRLVFASFSLWITLISDSIVFIGLPQWFLDFSVALITVLAIMSLLAAYLKWRS